MGLLALSNPLVGHLIRHCLWVLCSRLPSIPGLALDSSTSLMVHTPYLHIFRVCLDIWCLFILGNSPSSLSHNICSGSFYLSDHSNRHIWYYPLVLRNTLDVRRLANNNRRILNNNSFSFALLVCKLVPIVIRVNYNVVYNKLVLAIDKYRTNKHNIILYDSWIMVIKYMAFLIKETIYICLLFATFLF